MEVKHAGRERQGNPARLRQIDNAGFFALAYESLF